MTEDDHIRFDKVAQPHDKLIKWSFGRNYVASAHCKAYCPESFLPIVDWDKLSADPGSFVDPNLSELHTDLLFKAPLLMNEGEDNSDIYFYFLIEHITNPKADTLFRLAEYKLAILRKIREQTPKGEPFRSQVILPLIMHQGNKWVQPTRISDSLHLPANLSPQLQNDIRDLELDMGCITILVPKGQPEKIRGHILGRMTLAIMSAARENRALEVFHEHNEMIIELLKERNSMALFGTLLRYIFEVEDQSWEERQDIIRMIQHKTIKTEAMSIAEQLRAEGIEKGLEKGIEKGFEKGIEQERNLIAKKMIKAGKPDEEIAEFTSLSIEVISQLRKELSE